MKCTSPLYCLNRDALPFNLLPAWERVVGSSSKEYVKSTDLRTKYSFFHLILCKFIPVNSASLVA